MKIKSYLKGLTPYPPGKPIEELRRELGITGPIIKLASNENPLGPSPKALEAIKEELPYLHRYPEASGLELRSLLAERFGLSGPEEVVLGNGSNEVIDLLVRALVREGDEVLISHPSFLMYEKFTVASGGLVKVIPLKDMRHDLSSLARGVTERTQIVFLDNPNNPTGTIIEHEEFSRWLKDLPRDLVVVLDEAYGEFVRSAKVARGFEFFYSEPTVVVLRTFSKAYGLAGLRIGYGLMRRELAEVLNTIRQPFNVNKLAQKAALASLRDKAYLAQVQKMIWEGVDYLSQALRELGLHPYPTETNFILVDLGRPARPIYEALLRRGIIVRSMEAYGFPNCLRLTIGLPKENQALIKALSEVLVAA